MRQTNYVFICYGERILLANKWVDIERILNISFAIQYGLFHIICFQYGKIVAFWKANVIFFFSISYIKQIQITQADFFFFRDKQRRGILNFPNLLN